MKSTIKLNAIKQSYPNDELLQRYCDEVIEEIKSLEERAAFTPMNLNNYNKKLIRQKMIGDSYPINGSKL